MADQATLVFDEPATVAEKLCTPPVCTEAEGGLIATLTLEAGAVVGFDTDFDKPAQAPSPSAASKTQRAPPVARIELSFRIAFGFKGIG